MYIVQCGLTVNPLAMAELASARILKSLLAANSLNELTIGFSCGTVK